MFANSKIEPKLGEIITINGIKYITQLASDAGCSECAFCNSYCWNIVCNTLSRKDCKAVIFKKVETNMNEVKIQIPNNCELIKDGDTYVVREKKQEPPRSWEEFCERYPIKKGEAFIDMSGIIYSALTDLAGRKYRNWCVSEKEAESFLALMQLRQLRKAWVGDWEPDGVKSHYAIIPKISSIEVGYYDSIFRNLSFPTKEMAEEFLNCFRDLCETAKILL